MGGVVGGGSECSVAEVAEAAFQLEREPPESETSRIVFSSADERVVFAVGDDCVLARSPIKRDRSFASQNVSADLAVNGVFATVVSEIVFSAVVISIGYIWIAVPPVFPI